MKGLVVLIGKSGSGKTYLESKLCSNFPESFYKVISFTTREKRSNEIDGVNYHFITESQYNDNKINDNIFQETVFGDNYYGSFNNEFKKHPDKYGVLVAAPSDTFIKFLAKFFNTMNKPVHIIYFVTSKELAIKQMEYRGDDQDTINKRVGIDNVDSEMMRLGLLPDIIVSDEEINEMLPKKIRDTLMAGK